MATHTRLPEQARLLARDFFDRDPRRVARQLLGKLLVRNTPGELLTGRIVETEAYLGEGDAAAHAAAGKTNRNAVLFGPPGYAYVYLIYGYYHCMNVSCLPPGTAGGVLIRALQPECGLETMARRRGIPGASLAPNRRLTGGPGMLSQAFGITRSRDNGKDLVSKESDLLMMDDGFRPRGVAKTPRIGIAKAIEPLWRFIIAENEFVSHPR